MSFVRPELPLTFTYHIWMVWCATRAHSDASRANVEKSVWHRREEDLQDAGGTVVNYTFNITKPALNKHVVEEESGVKTTGMLQLLSFFDSEWIRNIRV